jgi:enoyl-CoA hydratase/carnithine racemase
MLSAMPRLDRDGDVHLLVLGDDENRFTRGWVTEARDLLQAVAATAPAALVTVAEGKFWSNGLDLEWLGQHPDELAGYVADVHGLLADMLALPVPTVAAIQGHAFAAGAMLALAHDWRVMRADRGFFCLPEVDIHIPFTPGMDALIRAKLPVAAAIEAMTTGRRYGGEDAAAAGLVTSAVPEADVLDAALGIARPLTEKAGPTLGAIKAQMHAAVVDLLRSPATLAAGS